jgi:hypothetical protein
MDHGKTEPFGKLRDPDREAADLHFRAGEPEVVSELRDHDSP